MLFYWMFFVALILYAVFLGHEKEKKMTVTTKKSSEKNARETENQKMSKPNQTIERKLTTEQENELLVNSGFPELSTNITKDPKNQTSQWKQDRQDALTLLLKIKPIKEENLASTVKKCLVDIKNSKVDELKLDLQTQKRIIKTCEIEKNNQVPTKTEDVRNFFDEKSPSDIFVKTKKLYNEKSGAVKKQIDGYFNHFRERLEEQFALALVTAKPEVRTEVAKLFNLEIEKEFVKFDSPKQAVLKDLSDDVKSFAKSSQEEGSALTIEDVNEFKKALEKYPVINPSTKPVANGMGAWTSRVQAQAAEENIDLENGQARQQEQRKTQVLEWLNTLLPRLKKTLNSCAPKFGKKIRFFTTLLLAMIYEVVKVMITDTGRIVGSLVGTSFYKINHTITGYVNNTMVSSNSSLVPAGFFYGSLDNTTVNNITFVTTRAEHFVAGDSAIWFCVGVCVLQILIACFMYKIASSSKLNQVVVFLLIMIVFVIVTLLVLPGGLSIAASACLYMWGVFIGLLFRTVLRFFVVLVSPPPSSLGGVVIETLFYGIGQIIASILAPGTTAIALGVVIIAQFGMRLLINGFVEAMAPLARLMFSRFAHEGFSFDMFSGWDGKTPKEKLKNKGVGVFVYMGILMTIFGSAFGIAIPLLTYYITSLSRPVIETGIVATFLGVIGFVNSTEIENPESISEDKKKIARVLRSQEGTPIRISALQAHLKKGNSYFSFGKEYQLSDPEYGEIELSTGIQLTSAQINKRVRFIGKKSIFNKNPNSLNEMIPLKELSAFFDARTSYIAGGLQYNADSASFGYGAVEITTGFQLDNQECARRLRSAQQGAFIPLGDIETIIKQGRPYWVGDQLYRKGQDGYGEIDFETGLQKQAENHGSTDRTSTLRLATGETLGTSELSTTPRSSFSSLNETEVSQGISADNALSSDIYQTELEHPDGALLHPRFVNGAPVNPSGKYLPDSSNTKSKTVKRNQVEPSSQDQNRWFPTPLTDTSASKQDQKGLIDRQKKKNDSSEN